MAGYHAISAVPPIGAGHAAVKGDGQLAAAEASPTPLPPLPVPTPLPLRTRPYQPASCTRMAGLGHEGQVWLGAHGAPLLRHAPRGASREQERCAAGPLMMPAAPPARVDPWHEQEPQQQEQQLVPAVTPLSYTSTCDRCSVSLSCGSWLGHEDTVHLVPNFAVSV